jgi:hypothetical protein
VLLHPSPEFLFPSSLNPSLTKKFRPPEKIYIWMEMKKKFSNDLEKKKYHCSPPMIILSPQLAKTSLE